MEKQERFLSLGGWPSPRTPKPLPRCLSPITKRILNQTHLTPQLLLPISYQHFIHTVINATQNQSYFEEYRQQVERRQQQVKILSQMRNNFILGRGQSVGQKEGAKKSNQIRIKSRSKSRQYERQLRLQSRRSKSKISRHLSRIISQRSLCPSPQILPKSTIDRPTHSPRTIRQQSEYFVHFDPHQLPQTKELESTNCNQAPRSRTQKTEHMEYGQLGFTGRPNIKKRKQNRRSSKILNQSRPVCKELLRTVRRWQKLDGQHLKERREMGELSWRQQGRLAKIQQLQKEMLGVRVRSLKTRLRSESGV